MAKTGFAAHEPIDTSGDPELEARWQAVVAEVIDAKAAAAAARAAVVEAERARGKVSKATPAALAAVDEAMAKYRAAGERVVRAAAAMKAGDL